LSIKGPAYCPASNRRGFFASNTASVPLPAADTALDSRHVVACPKRQHPGFIEPCIPTRVEKPPVGSQWIHEIKHDGYRLIALKRGDRGRLFTPASWALRASSQSTALRCCSSSRRTADAKGTSERQRKGAGRCDVSTSRPALRSGGVDIQCIHLDNLDTRPDARCRARLRLRPRPHLPLLLLRPPPVRQLGCPPTRRGRFLQEPPEHRRMPRKKVSQ
jgi:hypothetical protein